MLKGKYVPSSHTASLHCNRSLWSSVLNVCQSEAFLWSCFMDQCDSLVFKWSKEHALKYFQATGTPDKALRWWEVQSRGASLHLSIPLNKLCSFHDTEHLTEVNLSHHKQAYSVIIYEYDNWMQQSGLHSAEIVFICKRQSVFTGK